MLGNFGLYLTLGSVDCVNDALPLLSLIFEEFLTHVRRPRIRAEPA